MGHFAEIIDGIVKQVIVVDNDVLGEPTLTFPETDGAGRAYIANTLHLSGEWRQTSYSGSFRKRYAGENYYFDSERDEFVPPGWELVDGEWTAPPEPEPEPTV